MTPSGARKISVYVMPVIIFGLLYFSAAVSAVESLVVPYESYIYDFWGTPVPAPQAYLPVRMMTGLDMGADALSNPQDITVVGDHVYILDTGKHRIIELDENFQFVRAISQFQNGDVTDKFSSPEGFFVAPDGTIYVADTGKERVVILDNEGNLLNIITSPHVDYPDFFPPRFVFRPRKIGVDYVGRIYLIAQDLYEGIVVLNNDGEFTGFVGAPKVKRSALELFWSYLQSEEQRRRSQLYLPIEYASIDVDKEGFIYAVVAGPAEDEALKKLNPAGQDIITRSGFVPMRGDSATGFSSDENNDTRSRFVDVIGRQWGMVSVLDRQRGRIFTYDGHGNLLYVFGGIGDAIGLFTRPQAITTHGERILVLDADGRLTIFEPTGYARMIHDALMYYDRGDFERSTEVWQELTRINPNLDLAHSGIGRALFYDGHYYEAMESFRHGQNRSGYSMAYAKYRQYWVNDNFQWIAWSIIGLILIIYLSVRYHIWSRIKKAIGGRIVASWSESAATVTYMGVPIRDTRTFKASFLRLLDSLRYAWHVIFHPFDGFWDLKYEKRGTVGAANVLLILTVLVWVFYRQYTAFTFNTLRVQYLNIYSEATSILIPVLLWCACNWALTTLMEGKGTFKDIYIATAYALTPLILILIPVTLLSHVLIQDEGSFLALAQWIALIWMAGLLFVGTMVTHEYTSVKTILTSISTIAGIAVVLFIVMLFTSLVVQVLGFVYRLYLEVAFR
ncbi:MAG TPA: YIP1 family protein [Limnochordia bacterium]|nr:YIP1 family protein [Limnochordia bacterium]HPZ30270.1 YIP1 family protein [Limnochordia bacterium]